MRLNEVERFALVLVAVALVLAVMLIICEPAQAEGHPAYVLCDPESSVCVRETPKKNGLLIGHLMCGDELTLDGIWRGEWEHVIGLGLEMSEGWINRRYISYVKVTVGEFKAVTTAAKVRAREGADGKVLRRLKKGTEVRVLASSDGWSVTDKGFIKTKYLGAVTE